MRRQLTIVLTMALVGIISSASTAQATFPGRNGRIAFIQEEEDPNADEQESPKTDREVMVMQPDGSQIEQLTFNDVSELQVTWSADGSRLAVVRENDIYILHSDGSDSHALGVGETAYLPAWSPDGTKIAFVDDEKLFVKNADGTGTARRIGNFRGTEPAWSPTGNRIAFTGLCVNCSSEGFHPGIRSVRPDGSGLRKVTRGYDYSPDWAPDGRRLVFLREQRGGSGDGENSLMRVRADGTRVKELVGIIEGAEVLTSPVWSPNGAQIAFQGCSFIGDDGCYIFTIGPNGRDRRRIATSPGIYYSFYGLTWEPLTA